MTRSQYLPDLIVTEPGAVFTDLRAYSTLALAISGISTTPATLVISRSETITAGTTVTIPSNVVLRFTKGSILTLGAGATLVINAYIDCGRQQIFDSSAGTLTLGPLTAFVYPEWWGAMPEFTDTIPRATVTSPATYAASDYTFAVDCLPAITEALKTRRSISFGAGQYAIDGKITLDVDNNGIEIFGMERDATLLVFIDNTVSACIESVSGDDDLVQKLTIRDIGILGPGMGEGTGVKGISIYDSGVTVSTTSLGNAMRPFRINIRDARIAAVSGDGIYIPCCWNSVFERIEVGCVGGNGMIIGGSPAVAVRDIDFFRSIEETGKTAIWITFGSATLENVNIGDVTNGVRFGQHASADASRSFEVLSSPFNLANGYCFPSVTFLNVEEFTDTGVYFSSGSSPSIFANVQLYTQVDTAVTCGIRVVNAAKNAILNDVIFSTKGSGSYTKKLWVEGNTSCGLIYLGPQSEVYDTTKVSHIAGDNDTISIAGDLEIGGAITVGSDLLNLYQLTTAGGSVTLPDGYAAYYIRYQTDLTLTFPTATNKTKFTLLLQQNGGAGASLAVNLPGSVYLIGGAYTPTGVNLRFDILEFVYLTYVSNWILTNIHQDIY